MTKTMHGIVHGRTIELDEDPGVAEGQEVEVQVKVMPPTRKWGDGILRTAGALADDTKWERSWRKSTKLEMSNVVPKGSLNDLLDMFLHVPLGLLGLLGPGLWVNVRSVGLSLKFTHNILPR